MALTFLALLSTNSSAVIDPLKLKAFGSERVEEGLRNETGQLFILPGRCPFFYKYLYMGGGDNMKFDLIG